jgi:sec-independent protein translocase protein TatC
MTHRLPPPSDLEASRAPLLEHLREFKQRIIIATVAWMVGFALSYWYVQEIYGFLMQPLADSLQQGESRRLIYTSLPETFLTYIRLSAFAGLFLAFPVIAAQIYGFLSPGLYRNERRALLPYLIASPLLFVAGAALAYYQVFPLAWKFFLSFETGLGGATPLPIELDAKVSDYLALVMQLLIAFGLSFQMPIILTLLAQIGVVSAAGLARTRRYALVVIVIVAAILTPPDVFSQIALAAPLYLLYEISILSCRMVEKRKAA